MRRKTISVSTCPKQVGEPNPAIALAGSSLANLICRIGLLPDGCASTSLSVIAARPSSKPPGSICGVKAAMMASFIA